MFFLHLSCHEFITNEFQQLRLLSAGSHGVCFSGRSRQALALNPPRYLSLWRPSFFDHFPSHVSGGYLSSRVFNTLSTCIRISPFTCLFTTMPTASWETRRSSSFAVVTFVGHSFSNCALSLDVCNITFFVGLHVCGHRSSSIFSKRLREHTAGSLLFPFVLVIVANSWKMAVPAERPQGLFLERYVEMHSQRNTKHDATCQSVKWQKKERGNEGT